MFYVSGRLWEAHSVVFYVSGRLWEVHSVVFYVSGKLWEARSVVFYEALRLLGCPVTNEVKRPGRSARKGTYASFTRAGLSCV